MLCPYLVFTRENGAPLHPEYVTRHFQLLTRRAGLREIRLHDLRHGSASLQLAAGVPIAVVSKRLGIARSRSRATHTATCSRAWVMLRPKLLLR